jgi:hypothetical protein
MALVVVVEPEVIPITVLLEPRYEYVSTGLVPTVRLAWRPRASIVKRVAWPDTVVIAVRRSARSYV